MICASTFDGFAFVFFSVLFCGFAMFHVREKDVVQHRDKVDVENLILDGKKVEVDELRRRPDAPVDHVDFDEFGVDLFGALLERLPLHHTDTVEEQRDAYRRHDQLIHQYLFGHREQIAPWQVAVQVFIKVVMQRAHRYPDNSQPGPSGPVVPLRQTVAAVLDLLLYQIPDRHQTTRSHGVRNEEVLPEGLVEVLRALHRGRDLRYLSPFVLRAHGPHLQQ